jgi:acetamidase/formamidase
LREHTIGRDRLHHIWDADLEPILEVSSGDVVHFDIMVAGEGQIWPGASYEEAQFDFDTIYNLSGPLWIEGAEPGDTLQIDVLDLEHGAWGWGAIIPGLGLLPEEFPDGYVRTFDLKGKTEVEYAAGVVLPMREFLGTIGTHPGEPRRCVPFPPHRGGGNMDNRHLTKGSTLWLPVHLPGALFSCGDPHALQGDGEVSVTALEGELTASLRFSLHKKTSPSPSFRVHREGVSRLDEAGYHATSGISPDLMDASRIAVRSMISWLADEYSLDPRDAYMLCSFVGDLRIIEVVDAGVWTVAMTMPLAIFRA